MYDVEMMQMLNLIHAENQCIFEILRAGLLSNDVKDAVTFDDYDKEYKRIIHLEHIVDKFTVSCREKT